MESAIEKMVRLEKLGIDKDKARQTAFMGNYHQFVCAKHVAQLLVLEAWKSEDISISEHCR